MLAVELRVEVLWPVSEPPERSGLACELPGGLLAPVQVDIAPLVLFAPTRCVMFGVLRKPIQGGAVE